MVKKRILFVYYSLSGHTKILADFLSKKLSFDTLEIKEVKKRKRSPGGWIRAGFQGWRRKSSEIQPLKINFNKHDKIIIGSGIWAGSFAPALRSFIRKNLVILKKKNLFFAYTYGGGDIKNVKKEFKEIFGKDIPCFGFRDKDVLKGKVDFSSLKKIVFKT